MAKKAMTDNDLKAILQARVQSSLAYLGGRLAQSRRDALRYYNGDTFGNEQEGRSQVVTRDVAETIDSIMPSLMRVFFGGDEIVRFEPTGPEDEEAARQATDYVNWIFCQQNRGFDVGYTWAKDALLNRLGVVKCWWEENDHRTREAYEDLTAQELQMLQAQEDFEIKEIEVEEEEPVEQGVEGVRTYCVVGYRTNKEGRVRIEAVPGDEFLIDRRVVSLEDATFIGHRRRWTKSELLENGYPKEVVDRLSYENELDITMERIERFKAEDEFPYRAGNNLDPSTREIWVTECYVKVDYDNDGVAEYRKVTVAGDSTFEILDNEEVDGHPFAALCPIPMPHKLFGKSVADQTMDIQLVKSTVLRQALDNLYLANNKRTIVIDGQVNLDDLLVSRPGGVIRAKAPGAVTPYEHASILGEAFSMIEYFDQTREQRVGVTRLGQGLDEDTINKTAAGQSKLLQKGAEKVELIARVFAETGYKQLFRRILELVCKHQDKPKVIRLRNKWVAMDPSAWNSRMDLTASVGLGSGDRTQDLQHLMAMFPITSAIVQMQGGVSGPLVTAENVYNQLAEMVRATGLKSVDKFYSDPAQAQMMPQGQRPDPKMMEAQGKLQVQAAKLAGDRELAQQKMSATMQLEAFKAQIEAQAAKYRADLEAATKMQIAQLEAALKERMAASDRIASANLSGGMPNV